MESYSSSSNSSSTSKQQTSSLPYYHSALHSVRRTPAKPWKKPVAAPLPPTPPRVYKVDPINFRDLVQKLTAAPPELFSAAADDDHSRRLHSLAPPPVNLHRPVPAANAPVSPLSNVYKEFSEVLMKKPVHQNINVNRSETTTKTASFSGGSGGGFLGLNLSPSHNSWCSFPMLSPGTLSSLDQQSTVL